MCELGARAAVDHAGCAWALCSQFHGFRPRRLQSSLAITLHVTSSLKKPLRWQNLSRGRVEYVIQLFPFFVRLRTIRRCSQLSSSFVIALSTLTVKDPPSCMKHRRSDESNGFVSWLETNACGQNACIYGAGDG